MQDGFIVETHSNLQKEFVIFSETLDRQEVLLNLPDNIPLSEDEHCF